ncbi:leucyl aminopeptidase [Propionicicella superfundia]|uniref:leucyl aminopeptidase n=1 Tax=Propionicicella superfundia TaxID=348582 RepID=UPI00040B7E78|nr:leucyl aminopeptidase [Propionicicella superfundia]
MSGSRLPSISLARTVPADADVVVVGIAPGPAGGVLLGVPADVEKSVTRQLGRPLLALARSLGAEAKLGTATVVPGPGDLRIVLTGLPSADATPEQVRRAAGTGVRTAAGVSGAAGLRIAVSLDAVEPEVIRGAAEGALLGAYRYQKQTASPEPAAVGALTIVSASGKAEARQAVSTAVIIAEAVCAARDWINLPANLLYPESFADDARTRAKAARIGVEVLDETQLRKEGYGGLLAVGGGSSHPPRLVRYSYAPRGARFHLALVGKGITFDSGGLDLKTPEGMYTMKCDMSGAAAVLAATRAIADLGLKISITAYACLAENLPSGTAYRPSDVLTIHGGKTVENANSDAEGRLVMADGLARSNADDADLVVDIATLTGACMVALGLRTAGLMASDDLTADRVLDAAESAGELFWQLPIPEEIGDGLKSSVADLRSSSTKRYGGALTAAAFLREFVDPDRSWAHLDIAGPAFNDGEAYDYVPTGGTGFGVRTLIALATALAS